jgi:DNA-binding HxlR family transcriptional regulator
MVRMATRPEGLADAVGRVGDRWTLLIVDALLAGPRRFGELEAELDGLAPNVLSRRLKQLEADGVIVAEPYQERPVRLQYRLTASGAELADALRLLSSWGARHGAVAHDEPLHHAACGTAVETRWWCPTCDRIVERDEIDDLRYV